MVVEIRAVTTLFRESLGIDGEYDGIGKTICARDRLGELTEKLADQLNGRGYLRVEIIACPEETRLPSSDQPFVESLAKTLLTLAEELATKGLRTVRIFAAGMHGAIQIACSAGNLFFGKCEALVGPPASDGQLVEDVVLHDTFWDDDGMD